LERWPLRLLPSRAWPDAFRPQALFGNSSVGTLLDSCRLELRRGSSAGAVSNSSPLGVVCSSTMGMLLIPCRLELRRVSSTGGVSSPRPLGVVGSSRLGTLLIPCRRDLRRGSSAGAVPNTCPLGVASSSPMGMLLMPCLLELRRGSSPGGESRFRPLELLARSSAEWLSNFRLVRRSRSLRLSPCRSLEWVGLLRRQGLASVEPTPFDAYTERDASKTWLLVSTPKTLHVTKFQLSSGIPLRLSRYPAEIVPDLTKTWLRNMQTGKGHSNVRAQCVGSTTN
jgi:hypothetical protein